MSWPIKLRTMSFAITLGVVLLESVMGSILIALILWFASVATAATLFKIFAVIAVLVSLTIAVQSHIRPAGLHRRALHENNS